MYFFSLAFLPTILGQPPLFYLMYYEFNTLDVNYIELNQKIYHLNVFYFIFFIVIKIIMKHQ